MPGKPSIFQKLSRVPTPAIFLGSVVLALLLLWWQGSLGDVAEAARDADRRLLPAAAVLYLVSLALLAGQLAGVREVLAVWIAAGDRRHRTIFEKLQHQI